LSKAVGVDILSYTSGETSVTALRQRPFAWEQKKVTRLAKKKLPMFFRVCVCVVEDDIEKKNMIVVA
jgi:hypothetical protein